VWWDFARATPPAAAATAPPDGAASEPRAAAEPGAAKLRRARHELCSKSFSLLAAGLVQARGLRHADYAPLLGLVR
jgi:hypothetical protein